MRVLSYILIGFFLYYIYDAGGLRQGVNKIAGELYWNTMPAPIGNDIEDSIEKTLEDLRKKVDNF